ncbi:MAG: sulfurtransferase complex subunit TusD [Halieaceae bacterium]|jgi:tRNA 2-thiouridine synthesizing protein D|nr:sulfurtransferase complex subunit TusD [Halieaceae bacterium]
MIYSLLVLSPPHSGQGASTAVQFARAAISRGHSIHRVFFLDQGTYNACAAQVTPQDESDTLQQWVDLAQESNVELVLCIASALQRGLIDSTEARRYDKQAATIHPAFVISGLGQLVDASAASERMITFGC